MSESFVVICRTDTNGDGAKGNYTLATRRVFITHAIAHKYAQGINPSREPIVVPGDWQGLRFEYFEGYAE